MPNKIPVPIISVIGDIFNAHYSHSDIDRVFAYADAPGNPPDGNKTKKTMEWLRRINMSSEDPLQSLGTLLEDLMECEDDPELARSPWDRENRTKLAERREKITAALARAGLRYIAGGTISDGSTAAAVTLRDVISKGGLAAVSREMDRALEQVERDPTAAAHYAANVLEAALKSFLERKGVPFDDQKDTLNTLWQLTRATLKIRAEDLDEKDLQKIGQGLNAIVEGTMHIRNKKSGAHGRTNSQVSELKIKPRHARLVVNSSHTLAAYILECLAENN